MIIQVEILKQGVFSGWLQKSERFKIGKGFSTRGFCIRSREEPGDAERCPQPAASRPGTCVSDLESPSSMVEPPEDAFLDAPGSAQAGSALLCRVREQRALQEAHRQACEGEYTPQSKAAVSQGPVHTGIVWGRSSRPLPREHIPSAGPVCPMEIGGRPD